LADANICPIEHPQVKQATPYGTILITKGTASLAVAA
jgi:hypothetical protein